MPNLSTPSSSPPTPTASFLSPASPHTLLRRSVFLASRGRHADALHAASAALALLPDHHRDSPDAIPFLVQLASVHLAQNDLPNAERVYRSAVQLDPDSPAALTGLAVALKAGDPIYIPQALDLLRHALKSCPAPPAPPSSTSSSSTSSATNAPYSSNNISNNISNNNITNNNKLRTPDFLSPHSPPPKSEHLGNTNRLSPSTTMRSNGRFKSPATDSHPTSPTDEKHIRNSSDDDHANPKSPHNSFTNNANGSDDHSGKHITIQPKTLKNTSTTSSPSDTNPTNFTNLSSPSSSSSMRSNATNTTTTTSTSNQTLSCDSKLDKTSPSTQTITDKTTATVTTTTTSAATTAENRNNGDEGCSNITVPVYSMDEIRQDTCTKLAALLTDVGVRLKLAGLPASAIDHYHEALQVCPTYAHALYNLAVAHADTGDTTQAKQCYEKCLKLNPAHVEAWCNLGVLHRNESQTDLAMQAYERALSFNPNFELAKSNLAVALCEKATIMKETDKKLAKKLYKRALALQPSFSDAHYNLGVLHAENGKLERALVSYNLAVHYNPRSTEALNNLGVVYKELGNMEKALEFYKKALQYDKQHHQTHNNIAVVYTLMGNVDIAAEHLRLANALCPQYAEAYNNIGVLLRDQGDIDSAIWHYERCSQLDCRADMAAQNRLHALCYSEKWTKAQVYEQHKQWGESFQKRIDGEIEQAVNGSQNGNPIAKHLLKCLKKPPKPSTSVRKGPGTPNQLRVGYLSPDFFTHSVSYFAEVLLKEADRDGFEIFAYANVAQPDAKTDKFRQYVGPKRWRNVWGMTASAVGARIIEDDIDILVELAGHTANNRLDVMALRLAPVQVTWIGYPNTTGLSSIHYRVTDAAVDPPETSQQFTETLWRLPGSFLCYTPAAEAPADLPAPPCVGSGGIVTFGSFNVLAKLQARTIALWAAILKRVPGSRLLLKAKPFGADGAKRRMQALFERHGILADRLDLVPLIPSTRSHLQVYANVDVGLDPFPYAGTTTTCEALYMGVPVVTLGVPPAAGDHAHNVGVTLLRAVGLDDLVAWSDDQYVDTAVRLAADPAGLVRIRAGLRAKMMASPLGDARAYMDHVHTMFGAMWKERGGRLADDSSDDEQQPAGRTVSEVSDEDHQGDAGEASE